MNKIAVIGGPASGKTTLANKLSTLLNIPVYHLDKIVWKDGGVFVSQAEAIEKVSAIMKEPRWIIEGSMPRSKTLDMRIEAADTIVFYDLPLPIVLWRQVKRFFKYYNQVRPDMGGNNKQKYPFTWKEVRHAATYPTEDIYLKLEPYLKTKMVVIIKNHKDEVNFLRDLQK